MNEHMQAFIARAIRSISSQLHSSSHTGQDSDETAATAENSLHLVNASKEYPLDTLMAEILSGGSLIFPDPGNGSEADWCVLRLHSIDPIRDTRTFLLSGRLLGGADADEFVQNAYRHILRRHVDDEGRAIYPRLIETHQLSKRDVLRILVESPEAESMSERFLIIPQPSSWLPTIGITANNDTDFPHLIVKGTG